MTTNTNTASQSVITDNNLSLFNRLRVKASYASRNFKFDIFKDVHGNKIGIPCIDLSGQLVSVHLLQKECLFTTVRDTKNVEIYENDLISFNFKSQSINKETKRYCGRVVFKDACFGVINTQKETRLNEFLPISEFIPLFAIHNISIINESK